MALEISPDGPQPTPQLTVIIPARNEAESIRECLASLVRQSESGFQLGEDWELMVVDDGSSDATRQIAEKFEEVTVLAAPPLPPGWTGKCNAVWFAARQARGEWLLFTDADTIHEAGDLRRAIHEAERYHVSLLSYSPRQLVHGFWQRALMPLIFSALAAKYPPSLVNQPESPMAAANGQFLMISRAAYRRLGGHEAVRDSLIEDVELARRCKRAREGVRLRYAPDAVSTRMYRGFGAMCEGWTKNLALLFPDALTLGLSRLLVAGLIFGLPFAAVWSYLMVEPAGVVWCLWLWWMWRAGTHYSRTAAAHFTAFDTFLSPLALPLFAWLLLASWMRQRLHRPAIWKGREYLTRSTGK